MAELSVEQLKSIYNNEALLGRKELAECLGWKNIENDENMRQAIELDFIYDTLLFCAQKGFPWNHSCCLVNISTKILSECKGKSLVQVVQHFTDLCKQCQNQVDKNVLCSFTEYMFTTFLQHYNLYQTVLTEDRDNMLLHFDLLVETPPCPLPFPEGKDIKIWEYEEALAAIDQRGQDKKKELEAQQVAAKLHGSVKKKECFEKLEDVEGPLSREQLDALISDLATAHLSSLSVNFGHQIDTTMTDLTTTLEKNSLPRPQELEPESPTSPPLSVTESELLDDFPADLGGPVSRFPKGGQRAASRAVSRVGPNSSAALRKSAASRAGSSLSKSRSSAITESSPGKLRVKTAQVKDKPVKMGKSTRSSSRASRGSRGK